ncbi:MAG: AI-2E family transporter [Brachymonas sp.]|nr:AI-2E family transporter [Brachymonas sp.]
MLTETSGVDPVPADQAVAAPSAQPPASTAAPDAPAIVHEAQKNRRGLKWTLVLLNVALGLFVLKWAEAFFIPFVAGIFLSYTLGPVVDKLEKFRVPRSVGSAVAVLAFVGLIAGIGYAVWYQAVDLADSMPATIARVNKTIREAHSNKGSSIGKITEAAKAVDGAIQPSATGKAATPAAPEVAPKPSARVLAEKALQLVGGLGTLGSVLLLAYFLLAAGSQFRRKTVKLVGERWSQKRGLVELLDDVHANLQRFLASLFVSNVILGVITYAVLRVQGFENAAVWGVMAGVLHFIPYVGPVITGAGVFLMGVQQWSQLPPAIMASASTLVVATLIGLVAQTWIFGRIANINHTAQFVALLFFAWLWGSLGLLIAVPMLVVIKVICTRVEGFEAVAEYLRDGEELLPTEGKS